MLYRWELKSSKRVCCEKKNDCENYDIQLKEVIENILSLKLLYLMAKFGGIVFNLGCCVFMLI